MSPHVEQSSARPSLIVTNGHRPAYTVARVLLGLLLIANSPVGTLVRSPSSGPDGDALLDALWHSPWIMIFTKMIELAAGILLVTHRFVPLALLFFAPVLVNILGFQAAYSPRVLPLGALILVLSLFVAWKNRTSFAPLFRVKAR